jgi:hypothetical protein
MVNYLNIHDIWKTAENEYIPRFNENIEELIAESKIDKRNNDYIIEIIFNFVVNQ